LTSIKLILKKRHIRYTLGIITQSNIPIKPLLRLRINHGQTTRVNFLRFLKSLFYYHIRCFRSCCWAYFSSISTSVSPSIEKHYKQNILADASGNREELAKTSPVILHVDIQGVIGLDGLKTSNIRSMLQESREDDLSDDRVKAILLHIQTPGGTVVDSDGIYHEIQSYKERYKVPVYAYVDGLCASGGMYIACAADKIYTSNASIIGSVGVLLPSAINIYQMLEKIGVSSLTLYAGKGKDDLNPLRPWKPDEAVHFQGIIDGYYKQFVDIVTKNRPRIDADKLVSEYGAQVFLANEAQKLGFIDESNASYRKALADLASVSQLEEGKYQVISLEKKTWFNALFDGESALFTGTVKHRILLSNELDAQLMNQFLYLYNPAGIH
jgi:signal peptide peptidase SppA